MANILIEKSTSGSLSSDYTYTTNFSTRVKVSRISIHFSSDYNKTVTLTLDSSKGSNYDVVVYAQKIKNGDDFVLFQDIVLSAGDELKLDIEAKSGVTAYISVMGEHI